MDQEHKEDVLRRMADIALDNYIKNISIIEELTRAEFEFEMGADFEDGRRLTVTLRGKNNEK